MARLQNSITFAELREGMNEFGRQQSALYSILLRGCKPEILLGEVKRLLVVVTSEVFRDYYLGKEWEIRHLGARYNPKQILGGRDVEIRKGYSGERLERKLTGDFVMGSLERIFRRIPLEKAEPRANSIAEAVRENKAMISGGAPYIAFRVVD